MRVVSTDGAGALPAPEIASAIEKGWAIRGAFDNDQAGERLHRQLVGACRSQGDQGRADVDVGRERPRGKDWNADLQERADRAAYERALGWEEGEWERSWMAARGRQRDQGRERDRGGWDHDR